MELKGTIRLGLGRLLISTVAHVEAEAQRLDLSAIGGMVQ